MNKNTLLRGVLATGLALSLSLSLVACSTPAPATSTPGASTPPTESSAPAATPAPALTKEEYMTKLEELGTKMTEVQTSASTMDPTDMDAMKKLLDEMKVPFVDFAAIIPPEEYAEAHTKLQAGCNDMIQYIDILLQIAEETDATKQQELATQMMDVLTSATTNLTEGSELLAAAG